MEEYLEQAPKKRPVCGVFWQYSNGLKEVFVLSLSGTCPQVRRHVFFSFSFWFVGQARHHRIRLDPQKVKVGP